MNRHSNVETSIRCACASGAIAMTLALSGFIDFLATRHLSEVAGAVPPSAAAAHVALQR